MFKIDNNVPIPNKPYAGAVDFFKTLEVGQSFLVPTDSRHGLHQLAKRAGIKISTKKDGLNVRIWRIA